MKEKEIGFHFIRNDCDDDEETICNMRSKIFRPIIRHDKVLQADRCDCFFFPYSEIASLILGR